ncbi:winged helix-turn-helix domain-containing protein [Streptomyces sp. NPDC008122]|uniref:winged helix-turn-helix domain-containing protein n=1 Tax=Streptomyces sp. NPDC008122 TaxID=3364810 RepID=UPI0036EB5A43
MAALVAGRDREDVAAVFGVSLKAVDQWRAGGAGDASARQASRGASGARGAEQTAVRQAVLDHRPCDVGLSGRLWTRRLVGNLITKLHRVRLTEVGVGTYLKRWGLSFQHPDKRAVTQDSEAVARWHRQTWPKIRAKAKDDGGEILFASQAASAPTRSPAAPGARRAGRPWCGGARTGSR